MAVVGTPKEEAEDYRDRNVTVAGAPVLRAREFTGRVDAMRRHRRR